MLLLKGSFWGWGSGPSGWEGWVWLAAKQIQATRIGVKL
jgi:hypothetical protein